MHPAIIIGIVRSLIVDVAMGQIPRSTERISSLFYYHSTVSADTQWIAIKMYSRGSVVGKASTTGTEISLTLPQFSQKGGGGQIKKCKICRRFKHHSTLNNSHLKIQQDIRTLKQKCLQCCDDRLISSPSLVKLGPRTSEKALPVVPHPIKLHGENVPNHR